MSGIGLATIAFVIGLVIVLIARWLNPPVPEARSTTIDMQRNVSDPKIIAAITAVLVAHGERAFRVTRIRYLQQPPVIAAWNEIGRSQLFMSHQIHRNQP